MVYPRKKARDLVELGSIAFFRDADRTAEDIRRFSPRDARAFLSLMDQLGPACETAMSLMATRYSPPGRGSSHAIRPFHRTYFSGSTKNSNTTSGGASMRTSRSMTPAAASTLSS